MNAAKRFKPETRLLIRTRVHSLLELAAVAFVYSTVRFEWDEDFLIEFAAEGPLAKWCLFKRLHNRIPDPCLQAILRVQFCFYCKRPNFNGKAISYTYGTVNDELAGPVEYIGSDICNHCIWDDAKSDHFFHWMRTQLREMLNFYSIARPDELDICNLSKKTKYK